MVYLAKTSKSGEILMTSPETIVNRQDVGELHISVNSYIKDEIVKYKSMHGNLGGFSGTTSGNTFVLDIDAPMTKEKEFDTQLAAETTAVIARLLEENQLEYELFFSGKKGYHIYVYSNQINIPTEYNNKHHKAGLLFATWIYYNIDEKYRKLIDQNLYNALSFLRAPFSLHPDTQITKMLIKFNGTVS